MPAYRTVGTDAVERLVARSGIGPDSTVMFYGYAPALGLWLMKLYGLPDVRILDCSRDTWRAAGHPWSTAAIEPAAARHSLGGQDRRLRVDRAAVHDAIGRPGTTLVDVRSAAEYRGDCFWPSGGMEPGGRAGHLPSAVHQPIDSLYNADGSFRSAAQLRRVFSSAVLDGGDELITYCTIGGARPPPGSCSATCSGVTGSGSMTGHGLSGAAHPAPPSSIHKRSRRTLPAAPADRAPLTRPSRRKPSRFDRPPAADKHAPWSGRARVEPQTSGVRGLTGSDPEWTTGHRPAAVGGSVREPDDSTRHLRHKAS